MRKPILVYLLFLLTQLAVSQEITPKGGGQPSVETVNAYLADSSAFVPTLFTSANLPIVLIDTYGQTIPDSPKIPAGLKIIDNGPGVRNNLTDPPTFDGYSGIEIRGSSSQMFPKKSYGIETRDDLGASLDTSLLGMPAENDWILNANYSDKSLLRNVLAYQVWRNMGYYSARYRFVEVVLNGQYIGVYIFSEKIKRDKNRLDIAKLSPDQNSGDVLTGGYIFKIDKTTGSGGPGWTSTYPPYAHPYGQTIFFQYEYPQPEDITLQQKGYIQSYVYNFETALSGFGFADTATGYRKYAVENTFIDYFLVNEISKNVDGYRISTFINKERESKGGKIRMGPVWDYDIAWHNANYCGGDGTTGWAYQFPCSGDGYQIPFWWDRLLQDPAYRNHMKCRWLNLRQNILSDSWFDNYIDSISGQLMEAQQRNFTTWPILGVYVWPNPAPFPPTYEAEVAALKSWIHNRMAWLDMYVPGVCDFTAIDEIADISGPFRIYPNPVADMMNVGFKANANSTVRIEVINQQGYTLYTVTKQVSSPAEVNVPVDMTSYAPGVYLTRLIIDGKSSSKRFIKN